MSFEFFKMQACGNDFVIIDMRQQPQEISSSLIKKWADRHYGIGFDSLLTLSPPKTTSAEALYRVFNADGSEAGQCGNGARCIAQLLYQQSSKKQKYFTLDTIDQPIHLEIIQDELVKAALAIPHFTAAELPINLPARQEKHLANYHVDLAGYPIYFYGVSLGNPHAVIFVDDLENAAVEDIGFAMNNNKLLFPEGINVSFVKKQSANQIHLRVYERGVGQTLACGSAACASAFILSELDDRANHLIDVQLSGGSVQVEYKNSQQPICLLGPATMVFRGYLGHSLS